MTWDTIDHWNQRCLIVVTEEFSTQKLTNGDKEKTHCLGPFRECRHSTLVLSRLEQTNYRESFVTGNNGLRVTEFLVNKVYKDNKVRRPI